MFAIHCAKLTAENHHEDGEYLFGLREGGHVAEADAGHAGQREVEGSDVRHRAGRPAVPDRLARLVAHRVAVANVAAERLQPAVEDAVLRLDVADREPDAGEPVRDQHEHDEQQSQHCRSVLDVQVQLAGDSSQTQQPYHLQRAELRTYALRCIRHPTVSTHQQVISVGMKKVLSDVGDFLGIHGSFNRSHISVCSHHFNKTVYKRNANNLQYYVVETEILFTE